MIKLILLALLSTHSVTLSWTGTGSGFNVYRGAKSGGPYTKLTTAPVTVLTYTDSTVAFGTTYYYVVTALAPKETGYSNELSAVIPAAAPKISCTWSTATSQNVCSVTGQPSPSTVQVCVTGGACTPATRP